ncbi:MAG TPA: GH3 auxin-responsive promoter family protein, partial [Anaerolineae bacterium]|nr:GH3 auxin-responsive promoter family protein [Anaerolineae bacterium]
MARELTPEQQQTHDLLTGFVQPWHDAVANPQAAQDEVLRGLLDGYARTRYGREHGAGSITTLEQYRERFPVVTYEDLKPLIQRTMAGETELLLYEEPAGWAITRGTTRGESKFIPMTPTDIMMRVAAGRAVMQYTLRSGEYDVFDQYNLNLNFPSVVGTVRMGGRDVEYGYSSGIYVKHVSRWTPLRSLPTQEDIDALGGGKTIADWERRFELAYQRCCSQPVSVLGGVAPTAVAFARYLKKA